LRILDGKKRLIIMDLEAIAEKYSMKDLLPLAKKYSISARCPRRWISSRRCSQRAGRAGRQVDLALKKMTY
jgi:hypothetical protein